ncbi:uncharacterized protein LOC124436731 isoform X2 [Xenia sp. Carnegie-2017]|uniref:uncharacterized protein LOC124436731 isoform X2 n=1 Tax=Xenia sp. Carnegie-2017 TaxID=2897299 RepID=UPI001F043B1F|nr:uncharacterized protein LOC124436731 isoform X2 [Xenia sp. Carnegie-2017]
MLALVKVSRRVIEMEPDSTFEVRNKLMGIIKAIRPIDVAVVVSSLVAMYLFRLQDGFQLMPIWQLKETESAEQSIKVPPLIVDFDGNGLKEIVIVSASGVKMFSFHSEDFGDEHDASEMKENKNNSSPVLFHLHQKAMFHFNEMNKTEVLYPIAMNSGCLSHRNSICPQVLAIVWNDWSVTLLSHDLKILWKSRPMTLSLHSNLQFTEMAVKICSGDETPFDDGLVIISGVLHLSGHSSSDVKINHHHHQSTQVTSNKTPEEISDEQAGVEPENINNDGLHHDIDPNLTKYIGHFTTYALNGNSGKVVWKHEPVDLETSKESHQDHRTSHFKLQLRKKAAHRGEVYWTKYSDSFLDHLPFFWTHPSETSITLAEFTTAKPKKRKRTKTEVFMSFVGNGGTIENKTASSELNSVVIKHSRGIDVLNLENGEPLSSLQFDSKFSTFADVNGDETIDLIKFYSQDENDKHDCFLVVSDANTKSSILFNSSVCYPSSFIDFFAETDLSSHENLRSHPPLATPTLKRSFGVLYHVLGHGLSRDHAGMDIIILTSSGRLCAFHPSGRYIWYIDTGMTWHDSDGFVPSLKLISLSSDEIKDGLIILGSRELLVVSLLDGDVLSTHSIPCVPTLPLLLGDINNDVNDEFLVRCSDSVHLCPRVLKNFLLRHQQTNHLKRPSRGK